jgi:drug/metabolite transporter (DMT)-like permease
MFWPEVASVQGDLAQVKGLLFALFGSIAASAGNLATQRLYAQKMPVMPSTAWGMLYGSLATTLYCIVAGIPFAWDGSTSYVVSLAYLTVAGTVVAFAMYLTLLKRVGAGRSGYTSAVIPVIAMLLSTLFEDYVWTLPAVIGMLMVMIGNVLVMRGR